MTITPFIVLSIAFVILCRISRALRLESWALVGWGMVIVAACDITLSISGPATTLV